MKSRILTTKGYSILKSQLSETQTQYLKEQLTVVPNINAKFATKAALAAATFKVYRESPTRMVLQKRMLSLKV
jgi:hypothetical protein